MRLKAVGNTKMIIGIVGTLAAGKDEVAKYLVSKEATHVSLSNEILKEIKKRKIPVTRKAYVEVANDLRSSVHFGVLAERALSTLKKIPDFTVVSSIRNPGEIKVVLKYPDSYIIAVIASQKIRFARVRSRAKKGDIKTWREILSYDREALRGNNSSDQQIEKCLMMTDFTIKNNGTIKELHKKIDKILNQVQDD